jgi:hypothetical protein
MGGNPIIAHGGSRVLKGHGLQPALSEVEGYRICRKIDEVDALKGTGFSPYISADTKRRALQAAEKLVESVSRGRIASGHDFSRAGSASESMRALALEGCFRQFTRYRRIFKFPESQATEGAWAFRPMNENRQ